MELLGLIPVLLVERPGGRIVSIRVQAGMLEPFRTGGFLEALNHFRSVSHTAILRQHTEPPEPSGFLIRILDIQPGQPDRLILFIIVNPVVEIILADRCGKPVVISIESKDFLVGEYVNEQLKCHFDKFFIN